MARKLHGFLKAYKKLASSDTLEKAGQWYESCLEVPSLRGVLELDKNYKVFNFRKFSSFEGESYDLILSLDILRRLLILLSAHCVIAVMKNHESQRLNNIRIVSESAEYYTKSISSISIYIANILESVFNLIFLEQDTSTRILSRSAIEASDYWIAIQGDPSLAKRYVESNDDFDKLWYAELRSNKLVKLRRSALMQVFDGNEEIVDAVCQFRDGSSSDFSQAVHPSYTAGVMDILSLSGLSPKGPEWSFLKNWPFSRSTTLIIDTCALPLIIETSRAGSGRELSIPICEETEFSLGRTGVERLQYGALLALSTAAAHHTRFPTREA